MFVLPGALLAGKQYVTALRWLQKNMRTPRFVVWMAMGKDVKPPGPVVPKRAYDIVVGARILLAFARIWVRENHLVFGGSAKMWGYQRSLPQSACQWYDAACKYVCQTVSQLSGASCITAGDIFEDLGMDDPIGVGRRYAVDAGFAVLAKWGAARDPSFLESIWTRGRARL